MPQYKEVEAMSFNFGSDFGSFFSTSGSSSSSGMSNFLSDYASIKNGSYGKLLKSYYKKANNSSSSSSAKRTSTTVDDILREKMQRERKVETAESKAYTKVKSTTSDLKKAVDKISNSKTLFEEKLLTSVDENGVETKEFGYDKNAIYNALNDFVKSYNSVLTAANSTGSSSITSRMDSMVKATYDNRDGLKELGITIKADNTLSIDKDAFMKADMGKVQNIFKDKSYNNVLDANADMMRDNANYEQLRANTYTYDGTFDSTYNSGKSYSSTI